MKTYLAVLALAFPLLTSSSLSAGVIPGRWEKIQSVDSGTPIVIELKSGEQIEGTYSSLSIDALSLQETGKSSRTIKKAEVRRIVTAAKVADSKWNGALIGAGIGFALGFTGSAVANNAATASGPVWCGEAIASYASVGIVTAVIGAVVSTVIDGKEKGT